MELVMDMFASTICSKILKSHKSTLMSKIKNLITAHQSMLSDGDPTLKN